MLEMNDPFGGPDGSREEDWCALDLKVSSDGCNFLPPYVLCVEVPWIEGFSCIDLGPMLFELARRSTGDAYDDLVRPEVEDMAVLYWYGLIRGEVYGWIAGRCCVALGLFRGKESWEPV